MFRDAAALPLQLVHHGLSDVHLWRLHGKPEQLCDWKGVSAELPHWGWVCVCVCVDGDLLSMHLSVVWFYYTLYLVPQPPAGCPWTLVPVKRSQTCGPSTQPRGSVYPSYMEAAGATAINSIARRSARSTAALWWEMVGHTLHQKIADFLTNDVHIIIKIVRRIVTLCYGFAGDDEFLTVNWECWEWKWSVTLFQTEKRNTDQFPPGINFSINTINKDLSDVLLVHFIFSTF